MYSNKIDKKWHKIWDENKAFHAENDSKKDKFYYLVEFPYPSGAGLHVGHVRSYTAIDSLARKKRMQGYNVLFPMGWDAFGNPAEQYAIKHHIHPKDAVKENIATFKKQIVSLGISFDWDREVSTCDPEYYKWTQWQFIKFFEAGMAYKAKKNINWCPKCKTGLSNEDSSGGVCVRCGTKVVQKEKEQWMLRMSDYSQSLIDGLKDTNFEERIKIAQINWIGRSDGAEVNFKIDGKEDYLKVYTTRPDTLFGATFMVVAPEHPILEKYKDEIENYDEIKKYQKATKEKTEFERTEVNKDKTGIKVDGIMAINPLNGKKLPIFVADYVMMNYGTGAIMAVPAHDERDYEFAKKHNLEIIQVIDGGDISKEAYAGDGLHINSEFLNGLDKIDGINKAIEYIEKNKIGNRKVNYRLQDWIFSRQRFWGEPIPLIHCDHCGWVAVPQKDLPVKLPDVAQYEPTEDGQSPLAKIEDWVNTTCPKCGRKATRETDTMPNWAGSSWYWLRYMDPHNDKEFASQDALKYWGRVDFYNGGMEHATRHLLYARFWNQFLYNQGLVPQKEPFDRRVSHGMILGEGGVKMSKSLGNVINPDDIVSKYGADSLRVYEMFIGDYEKEATWSETGLNGCKRFIERLVKLGEKVNGKNDYSAHSIKLINKTIKKVTEDYDSLKFNTVVSSIMILCNHLAEQDEISNEDYKVVLTLLNPIAPHITEELNEKYNLGGYLYNTEWPTYDKNELVDDEIEIPVQVNGKIRYKINVESSATEKEIEDIAKSSKELEKYIEGKQIKKVIVVKSRIVNIVIA